MVFMETLSMQVSSDMCKYVHLYNGVLQNITAKGGRQWENKEQRLSLNWTPIGIAML